MTEAIDRQEFRRHQGQEFEQALYAAAAAGGHVVDIEEVDGETVVVIRREVQ